MIVLGVNDPCSFKNRILQIFFGLLVGKSPSSVILSAIDPFVYSPNTTHLSLRSSFLNLDFSLIL